MPSLLLLPLLTATATLAQSAYPTTTPEELLALKYPKLDSTHTAHADGSVSHHDKRRPRYMGIYVCNQEHWRGNCWYAPQNGNACQNWDVIHSFGPDNGVNCDVFEGENCNGRMAMKFVSYPGWDTMPGRNLKSWRCGSRG